MYNPANAAILNKPFILYGFIKGRSKAQQLLKILDDWTFNLDLGNQIDVIYTDFEKAFDKIPHHGLLCKLHASGLNTTLINWLEDFLCNRTLRSMENIQNYIKF